MFPCVIFMKNLRLPNVSIHRNFDQNHLKNECARKNLAKYTFATMTFKVMLKFMEIYFYIYSFAMIKIIKKYLKYLILNKKLCFDNVVSNHE